MDKKGYIIGINGVNELEEAIIKAQEFKPVKYEKKRRWKQKNVINYSRFYWKNIRCKISGRRGKKCSKVIKKIIK